MRLQKRENASDDDDTKEKEDMALAVNQVKGKCNYCGRIGHKALNCQDNPRNRRGGGRWEEERERWNGGERRSLFKGGVGATVCQ